MFSKIKQFFSNLDLRLFLFSSNNCRLSFGDKVYIKGRIKGIRSYSPLTLQGMQGSDDKIEYHLVDENNKDFLVDCDSVYPYRGQNLKNQKIYDIVSHSIVFAVLAAVIAFLVLNPNVPKNNSLFRHFT